MSAGYSKRPLPEKLGIKPGFRICILNAPTNYADLLGGLPTGVELLPKLKAGMDCIQILFEAAIGTRTRLSASQERPRPNRYAVDFLAQTRVEDPNRCE